MFQKSTQNDLDERLQSFIKSAGYKTPTPLQQTVLPHTLQGRDIVVEAGPGVGRTGLFIISLLLQIERRADGLQGLIISPNISEVFKVLRQYRRFSARLHGRPHIIGLGTDENVDKEIRLLSRHPDIVVGTSERIIDHLRRESIQLHDVTNVILIISENSKFDGYNKDVEYICSKLPDKYVTQAYYPSFNTTSVTDTVLKRPIQIAKADWNSEDSHNGAAQKEDKMAENSNSEKSKVEEYIKSVLQKVKEEEDPQKLNEYRKIFRRHTPFHLRAYVAAYLLKETAGTGETSTGGFKTLFVSIGKNRKVFPKDFMRLFTSQLGITEAELGEMKILDNYSFIDISNSQAQKAIDTLNNTEFRGRKLTVNYARKKRHNRG